MGYEKAKQSIEESVAKANLGYIDLYVFHSCYSSPT